MEDARDRSREWTTSAPATGYLGTAWAAWAAWCSDVTPEIGQKPWDFAKSTRFSKMMLHILMFI